MEKTSNNIVRGGEVGPAGPGEMVRIAIAAASQSDFCPTKKKHFFFGIAKSLGCQFCAPPEPPQVVSPPRGFEMNTVKETRGKRALWKCMTCCRC